MGGLGEEELQSKIDTVCTYVLFIYANIRSTASQVSHSKLVNVLS